ncbi:MAG: flagellar motor protein MotB [Acetobacteraceae bacterium]
MSGKKQQDKKSIIIRREEVVEGGHHGGAWKVAYADFVTAMMAFFLLMWLLNATTQEQKRGLADYFSPSNQLARVSSGYGAPFGGRTPNVDGLLGSDKGSISVVKAPQHPLIDTDEDTADAPALTAAQQVFGSSPVPTAREGKNLPTAPDSPAKPSDTATKSSEMPVKPSDADIQKEIDRREKQEFERAAQQIREAVRVDPALADLAKQLVIEITPEGLRIQLLDADRSPMFSTGSSVPNERAGALLGKVAPVLLRLAGSIAISGHTDATPYRGGERTNWDLSADRANATRRALVDAGLAEARVRSVTGHADRDPLIPSDTTAPANRRIAITVLRDRPAS